MQNTTDLISNRKNTPDPLGLGEISVQLHRTEDALDPAVRADGDRRNSAALARAATTLSFGLLVALIASVMLNGVLGWFAVHPIREYFASEHGRILPLVALSQPYRSAPDVIQTAKDTVTRSFTLDFDHWQAELEDVRPRYDREGFKSFLAALAGSGILEQVKTKRMDVSVSTGTGVLAKDGIEDGVYVWYVEFPLELKLVGQTTENPAQRFKATVRITRVPTLDSVDGVAVGQIITKPI